MPFFSTGAIIKEDNMNTNQIVKPKIDVVFKKLFGDPANEHILKAFIADMLVIDKNRIT